MTKGSVFSLPLGADFARSFVEGFLDRVTDPMDRAACHIFVNTERTKRRMIELFAEFGPGLLPQIHTLSHLANDPLHLCGFNSASANLSDRLELARLIRGLLAAKPELAPAATVYELADSLYALMDEAHGERVALANLAELEIGEHAAQWEITKEFLAIFAEYEKMIDLSTPAKQTHAVLDVYEEIWNDQPTPTRIFIVGSTGSRGQSLRFMKLVRELPNGVVVLPGVDPNIDEVEHHFSDTSPKLDHPQGVLLKTMRELGVSIATLNSWEPAEKPKRNDLLSLALVPAPVTDRWLVEAPKHLENLDAATAGLALLEAEDVHSEATAIAAALREAVEAGKSTALITPNRILARRVSTQLLRWGIIADDSAGQPLHLSPEGILIRMIADGFGKPLTPNLLLNVLSHALTHQGEARQGMRSEHALLLQEFDIQFLRQPIQEFDLAQADAWAKRKGAFADKWLTWVKACFVEPKTIQQASIADWSDHLTKLTSKISAGSHSDKTDYWQSDAGGMIGDKLAQLLHVTDDTLISAFEFSRLLANILQEEVPTEPSLVHPNVAIWGTLEARVQGADFVVLGGLNETVWPVQETPDIWLSREMRLKLGMLPPERRIGLAAHDFQQAAFAPEVLFTRSLRDVDAQTTPSRWLLRLTNLLAGIDKDEKALKKMKRRGQKFSDYARQIEVPKEGEQQAGALRPSPKLPDRKALSNLSVTDVKTLIKNPYAIYAKRALGLKKLDPVGRDEDARDRGTMLHSVVEEFTRKDNDWTETDLKLDGAKDRFLETLDEVLSGHPASASNKSLWRSAVLRVVDWFLEGEVARRKSGTNVGLEAKGEYTYPELGITLRTVVDRIDQSPTGYRIYDYKAGKAPKEKDITRGDKQLSLMALILRAGGVDEIARGDIDHLEFIGFHREEKTTVEPGVSNDDLDTVEKELLSLLGHYARGGGFVARDRPEEDPFYPSEYDHLARFSEWTDADDPVEIDLT